MSDARLLLCTDLDRTLLPNGPQAESPAARRLFARLVAHPGVTLAYVTGRHLALVRQAIENYRLPAPDFAITDVGTRIHARQADGWEVWADWETEIAVDWGGRSHDDLRLLFQGLPSLRLQEPSKQNTHKLSYYLPVQADRAALHREMTRRLEREGLRASLIWSVDEPAGIGLLDVLPARATKLHAVQFLRQRLDLSLEQTLFAGDSGNDLQVMASEIPAVLVANATDEVRAAAETQARQNGNLSTLYVAVGDRLGLNGNYSGGILEGVCHYHPGFGEWLEEGMSR